jgi:type I restriction enzyme S subunit
MSKNNENKLVPNLRFPEFKNNGEWKENSLNEVSPAIFDGTHQTPTYTENGIPFFSVENIISGNKNKFISQEDYLLATSKNKPEKGDIIITRIGNIGTSKVIDWDYEFSVYVTLAIVKKSPLFDSHYLHGYFQSSRYQKEILSKSLLNAVPCKINMDELRKTKILLPPDKEKKEQLKIAACLSSLDEIITAESQKLDLLNKHKRGLLQNLLPVGKETIPKFRFKEFEKSDEWVEDTLINLANFRRGSFPQPYGLPEWYDDENGMPFIQVFDVGEDFRLKPATKRKISELAAQQSVFIPRGTLIITIQGSIGRVAITQYDAYIDRTLLLFEEFHQEIDINFFAYTLFLLFEIEKQKAPGGIIKTITKEVLSGFVVKLPSIEEQRKIAGCLSCLDELISAQNKNIEALQQHKKGLLQGMFPNINEVTE